MECISTFGFKVLRQSYTSKTVRHTHRTYISYADKMCTQCSHPVRWTVSASRRYTSQEFASRYASIFYAWNLIWNAIFIIVAVVGSVVWFTIARTGPVVHTHEYSQQHIMQFCRKFKVNECNSFEMNDSVEPLSFYQDFIQHTECEPKRSKQIENEHPFAIA